MLKSPSFATKSFAKEIEGGNQVADLWAFKVEECKVLHNIHASEAG